MARLVARVVERVSSARPTVQPGGCMQLVTGKSSRTLAIVAFLRRSKLRNSRPRFAWLPIILALALQLSPTRAHAQCQPPAPVQPSGGGGQTFCVQVTPKGGAAQAVGGSTGVL